MKAFDAWCWGVLCAYAVPGVAYVVFILTRDLIRLWRERGYYSDAFNARGLTRLGRGAIWLFLWLSPRTWRGHGTPGSPDD